MIGKRRILFLCALLAAGGWLATALYQEKAGTPLKSSLAPAFQLLGHSTKAIDSLIARAVPVNSIDEGDLGQVIAAGYERIADKKDPDFLYLNDLLKNISKVSKKPFQYHVYVLNSKEPNAMALPGGVILVTKGLLSVMTSESEVVSVLAHELGHIERGHCFDAAKFQLLARKMSHGTYGQIADLVVNLMLRHSFSKTLEDQADEYAYALVLDTTYDPRGVGNAFSQLAQYVGNRSGRTIAQEDHANVIRDYFMSHPPLALRKEKFTQRAKAWWNAHSDARRFVGKGNLENRISYYKNAEDEAEWVTGETINRST